MVGSVLRDLDEVASLIANPPTDRPIAGAVGRFGRQVCDRVSAVPSELDGILALIPGAPGLVPIRIACGPYWDSQGYDGPTLEPPFEGGQCPGTIYSIQLGQIIGGTCGFATTVSNLLGPVESVSFEVVNVGGFPNPLRGNLTVVHAGGTTTAQVQGNPDNPPCKGPLFPTSGPDDCGDPDPVPIVGESPAPDPGPLPTGTGFRVGPRGQPYLVLPPILTTDDGTDVPTGDDGGYGPSGPGSGAGDDSPIPGDEFEGECSGEGGCDEEFDDPPEGERWIGGCVTITARPQGSGVIPQAEPDDIYPRIVGNARLLFQAGESPREVDTPVAIKQKTTCLWEPVDGFEVIGMRINVLPNYSYSITPYSVPIDTEE